MIEARRKKTEERSQKKEIRRKKSNSLNSVLCLLLSLLYLLPAVFCITLPFYPSLSLASQAEDEVARIQKAYEKIKDLKGHFVQKSYIKDLKRTDTYTGQFFIKSQKMRWEYGGDKPQIIYITGDDIIIYQKKEKQAFKTKFDRATYGQAPIALLGGFGDIKKEFDITIKREEKRQNAEIRLLLKPKAPMGNIALLELTLSKEEFPIESLSVIDTLSNRIEIYLKDVKINTAIKDNIFEFKPPEGVSIFQH